MSSTAPVPMEIGTYDAAYLELAVRRGLPLASLDTQFAKAAAAVGLLRRTN